MSVFFKFIFNKSMFRFIWSNVTAKFSAANLLNSGAVIYLPWSGILFSTTVRVVVVAKSIILHILFLSQ